MLQVAIAGDAPASMSTVGVDAVVAVAGAGGSELRVGARRVQAGAHSDRCRRFRRRGEQVALADGLLQPTADLLVGENVADVVDDRLGAWLADKVAQQATRARAQLRRSCAVPLPRTP